VTACAKVLYLSKSDAIASGLLLRVKWKDRERVPRAVHYCEACRGWHLTSQRSKGRNRYSSPLPE